MHKGWERFGLQMAVRQALAAKGEPEPDLLWKSNEELRALLAQLEKETATP